MKTQTTDSAKAFLDVTQGMALINTCVWSSRSLPKTCSSSGKLLCKTTSVTSVTYSHTRGTALSKSQGTALNKSVTQGIALINTRVNDHNGTISPLWRHEEAASLLYHENADVRHNQSWSRHGNDPAEADRAKRRLDPNDGLAAACQVPIATLGVVPTLTTPR